VTTGVRAKGQETERRSGSYSGGGQDSKMETILDSNSYEDPNFTATGTCSGLKCLYTNANSLTNKMSELRYRAEGMDIIAVTETWTSPDIKDGEINIDGYTMFRKDRLHGKGGGVILYVKDSLTTTAYETAYNTEFSESVWCKILLKNQELIVGVCYRSPTSNDDNNNRLLSLLENTVKGGKATRFLVMGDFNCPSINFRDGYVSAGPTSVDYKLFNKVHDLLLVENILQETHFREGTVPSSLDYVFTDEENIVQDIQVEEALGKSDHAVLHWRMVVEPDTICDSSVAGQVF